MIFRGRQLFRLKVGLVLAGGGAKGAYQAGVIRALWDLDLKHQRKQKKYLKK